MVFANKISHAPTVVAIFKARTAQAVADGQTQIAQDLGRVLHQLPINNMVIRTALAEGGQRLALEGLNQAEYLLGAHTDGGNHVEG